MQYNSVFVDEKYSKIVEPNLYGDAILQPGISCNDVYSGDAASGLVKIYRIIRDAAEDPKTPAGEFVHAEKANELIDLRLNNAFRKSKKIFQVTANAVPYKLAEETLQVAVMDNAEDRQYSGLACLAKEGTTSGDTAAITAANVKSKVVAIRKEVRKSHAKADTAIASVDVFAAMLESAGSSYTPVANDNTLTTGRIGKWLGMTWYEGDLLDNATAKYYDHTGTLQTVDLTKVELMIYDHRAFHIVDNLVAQRVVDATDFVGSYAQNEINTGFRVSNAKCAVIKTKA